MLDALLPIAQACAIAIPAEHRRPLAIVGAGAIVDVAHLPAYLGAGLEVTGIFDLDGARAREVAGRHGVARVYDSLEALLDDDAVEVVDIAVSPAAQPGVARAVLAAGKHLMCQKPLALEVPEAEALVAEAERAGVTLAVNQQLRFDEGMAAARELVRQGWIGEPLAMSFSVNITTDFSVWNWLVTSDRVEIMFHSLHYLDAIRSILGQPERVFCAAARHPAQLPAGETRTMSTLVYPGELRALLHVTHENLSGDPEAVFRIDGAEGSIKGTLGLLYDYPHGRPDTLAVFSRVLPTDGWLPVPITTRWLPDAFAGPMAGLLRAIAEGGTPPTGGRDNLDTLRLVHALYRSIETGESQRLAPVAAGAAA